MKNILLFIFMFCSTIDTSTMEEKRNYLIKLNMKKWRTKKKKIDYTRRISSELVINPNDIDSVTASNNTQDIMIPNKQIVNNNNQM